MQVCAERDFSGYFFAQALDFIAGYPATEGMLTYDPREVRDAGKLGDKQWLGRIKCIGYTMAHAISIPISPLVALVRIVAAFVLSAILLIKCEPKERFEALKEISVVCVTECAGVITSPLWNIAGVVRAACGIALPMLYLKVPGISQLSKAQIYQAASFMHKECSPSGRW